ncbi:MAG: hypothetical protein M3Y69_06830, partial [Verrucomicrobiota bacterium]|nr:hypothetical protein [Verrucomicrobiota bacterium]
MSVFDDLKSRKIYRAAAAYAVAAWMTLQISVAVRPILGLPEWTLKVIVALLFIGFALALAIGWKLERRPLGTVPGCAPPSSRRHLRLAALTLLPATLVALAFLFFYHPSATIGAPTKSIAVLPFASLSGDPENAYFATGIQDEILTRLAQFGDLQVISRTSTQRYQSAPENLREIAKQLDVAYVLEGSVQREGEKMRINVQLIDAATDAHRWAQIYNREVTDLLTIESEVAEKIARALGVQLTGREQRGLAIKATSDPAAYDAYLKGLAEEAGAQNQKTYEACLRYFGEAVRLDPDFALAWSHFS